MRKIEICPFFFSRTKQTTTKKIIISFLCCSLVTQAFFIGVQIEVEDAEVLPFPTTRQTLQEMLLDEEEKDFWDEAELAPAQERATAPSMPVVHDKEEEEGDVGGGRGDAEVKMGEVKMGEVKAHSEMPQSEGCATADIHPMEG